MSKNTTYTPEQKAADDKAADYMQQQGQAKKGQPWFVKKEGVKPSEATQLAPDDLKHSK